MRVLSFILVFYIVLTLVGGCSGNIKFDIKPTNEYEFSDEISAEGVRKLEVESRSGNVKVIGEGENVISVEASLWSTKQLVDEEVGSLITLEKKGDTARITIPEEKWKMLDITSVDYLIRVPVELMVDLNSNNGDLDVNGIAGEIVLNTDNGDVSCMDVKGDAMVKTQNGEIIAVGTSKNFEGETLNGDVDIEGFERVIVETKNGDMEFSDCGFVDGVTNHGDINIMSVRQFDLLTSLGDITIETEELEGESNADTKLGDIKITLSTFKSISADVSSAGDILLSGIEVSASEKEKMQDASSITLKSGGEGVLELNSKMGDISIIKE